MADDARAASGAAEALENQSPHEEEGKIMEDAMAAIAVSEDAGVGENDDRFEAAEVASIASDGTVDLEQLEEEENAAAEEKEAIAEATAPLVHDEEERKEEDKPAPSGAPEMPPGRSVVEVKAASASSSSSSSSSDSSSSSSSDSSDSDVEDVTDQYKKSTDPNAPVLRTMSESGDDDVDAEQWFDEPTLDGDGVEVVGVVEALPQDAMVVDDDDDDDEDVFLTPFTPKLERGSATKRQRPVEEVHNVDAGEETTSSDPEPNSDDEMTRKATHRRHKKSKTTTSTKTKATAIPPLVEYTTVPAKFDIFNGVAKDDSNFPFLKGEYEIRGSHRAFFTGLWGFTDADFDGGFVSKFEYSSSYLHNRHDGDRRPFSGTYGGYFNLRQFSGKITKIKEDHVQLHFLRLKHPNDENAQKNLEDEEKKKAKHADKQYEVFGEGKNRFGRFLVRGYYNAHDGRMVVRRHYLD